MGKARKDGIDRWRESMSPKEQERFAKLSAHRNAGYDGWIDQDGDRMTDAEHRAWCDKHR